MEGYARELRRILKKYNPKKLKKIDSLLSKYRGREQNLLKILRKKYGVPDPSLENVRVAVRVRPLVMADRSYDCETCVRVLGKSDLRRTWCRVVVASSSIPKKSEDINDDNAIEFLAFFRTYPGLQRQIGGMITMFMPGESGHAIQLSRHSGATHKIFKFGVGTVFEGCSQTVFYDQAAAHIVDSVLQGS